MQDAYEDTQQRTQHLRQQGYTVVEMWGCDWARLKDTSPDIGTFVTNLETTKPLNPRDAFCGGRTNAVKLYHQGTPVKRSITSMSPPCTHGSTRHASTLKDIQPLLHIPVIRTSTVLWVDPMQNPASP